MTLLIILYVFASLIATVAILAACVVSGQAKNSLCNRGQVDRRTFRSSRPSLG